MVTSILLCLSPHTADFAPNPKPLAQGWKMMKAWHWEIVSWIVSWHCATLRHCVTWSRPCSFHPPPQDSGLGHPPSWLWCCQPNVENRGNQLISINITQHQSTCSKRESTTNQNVQLDLNRNPKGAKLQVGMANPPLISSAGADVFYSNRNQSIENKACTRHDAA